MAWSGQDPAWSEGTSGTNAPLKRRRAWRRLWQRKSDFASFWLYYNTCQTCKDESFLQQSAFWPFNVIQVDEFGTTQKRVCYFLLVINSNFGPILHRFRDTATYWLKIVYFSYPSLIRRPRSLCSLWNFALKLTVRKLESWGYPTP